MKKLIIEPKEILVSDSKAWCKVCDESFKTIKEAIDHVSVHPDAYMEEPVRPKCKIDCDKCK